MVGTKEGLGALAYKDKSRFTADLIVAKSGTRDYSDIQSAIDAVAGDVKIAVKKGEFAPFSIANKNNIVVEGMGNATVIKVPDAYDDHAIKVTDASGIDIGRLYINGNKANQGVGSFHGIYCKNLVYSWIDKVYIYQPKNYGLNFDTGCDDNKIIQSIFNDAGAMNVYIVGSDWNEILGCHSFGSNDGFYLKNGSKHNTLNGCIAFANHDEFLFDTDCDFNTLAGCTAYNSGGHGLVINGSKYNAVGVLTAYLCDADGIVISGGVENTIDGCILMDNNRMWGGNAGIRLVSGSLDNIIRGCRSGNISGGSGQQYYGLQIAAGCNDNIAIGNNFKDNITGGILDQGTGTEKAHNKEI